MEIVEIETRDGLQRVPLDKSRITIGRLPGNDIVLPYTQISRHHAEIRHRNEEWWIIDLGSTNGLRVGGRQVKEHLLTDGDRVILAPTIFLYFNGKRTTKPITVEGSTVEMTALADASTTSDAARPTPVTAPQSSAMLEPSATSADDLASIAAVPAPRRRMGMVPPPSADQPPGTSTITPAAPTHAMPRPAQDQPHRAPMPQTTAPQMDEQDLWLLAGNSGMFTPPPTAPLPPIPDAPMGNATPAPAALAGPELPLSSPFALLRKQRTPTTSLPRRPILVSCPTCQASTAPDSPYCWSCHQTIARPCRQCGLFLLPIQAKCPRCAAANANAVKR